MEFFAVEKRNYENTARVVSSLSSTPLPMSTTGHLGLKVMAQQREQRIGEIFLYLSAQVSVSSPLDQSTIETLEAASVTTTIAAQAHSTDCEGAFQDRRGAASHFR